MKTRRASAWPAGWPATRRSKTWTASPPSPGRRSSISPCGISSAASRAANRSDLQPAAATSVTELRRLPLTAGDLRKYEPALTAQSQEPTVPLQAALEWEQQSAPGEVIETALVHIPLYTFKYIYQNQPYTAVVEAGSGKTLANLYPAKAEAPYLLAGFITAIVFMCIATFPLIGGGIDRTVGPASGILACLGAGIIAAPLLFLPSQPGWPRKYNRT